MLMGQLFSNVGSDEKVGIFLFGLKVECCKSVSKMDQWGM